MKNQDKKIIILGGGLSGLAAAEILSKHFKVLVFEKENFLGGLAAVFKKNGEKIPFFYHHIIKSNKHTLDYLRRFVKPKELNWQKIKVAIGTGGKISIINSPLELIKFNYLNLYEKIRFGIFGLYSLTFMHPGKVPEGLSAETWLNKYAGRAVTKKIFYHLYGRNKFSIPLNKISAKQFVNRLYEKEIQDYFTFPKEGYSRIIEGLKEEIEKNNGKIKLNARLAEINLKERYIMESGKKINYDIIINTIPSETFIKISKNIPKNFKEKIEKIKYCPAVNVVFGTKDFLKKGVYWINLFNERAHIIMQHSILCDCYKDKINWILRYGGSEEDLYLDDKTIEQEYLKVVKKYFPKAKIKWAKVIKARYAEPVYDIEYPCYMPGYKTEVPSLYFAGIQLTYPKIRNMNVALESGIRVAKIILKNEKIKLSSQNKSILLN
jgi:protoporphyrinogen oxidase